MKILVIEDNRELSDIMCKALRDERYVVEVAYDYRSGSQKVADYHYDCILLDVMLPDGNGLQLLRELKEAGKSEGVIVISARDSLDDKVFGLESGADDYLAKPFHIVELLARIRSVIRRKEGGAAMELSFGNVKINPDKHSVVIAGTPIEMSRKEYDILHYFLLRTEHLIKKEMLAEAVWGDHIDQTDNFDFLYAQVKNVRRKMSDAGANIEIKAIYGFGYKLIAKE
uniref:response regulator transcription factor n=1 Tax=Alistipes sp. TaxID=1872444 RepID=UPI0040564C0D